MGHIIILVLLSGHPSLHFQILNLCNQLAAAKTTFGQVSIITFPAPAPNT
jgi:hypothetical protein